MEGEADPGLTEASFGQQVEGPPQVGATETSVSSVSSGAEKLSWLQITQIHGGSPPSLWALTHQCLRILVLLRALGGERTLRCLSPGWTSSERACQARWGAAGGAG